jgi:hypothetical protein
MSGDISHAVLAVVVREVEELLAAWGPEIARHRDSERKLAAATKQALLAARRALGVEAALAARLEAQRRRVEDAGVDELADLLELTPEQTHVVKVLVDSHLSAWEARARRSGCSW